MLANNAMEADRPQPRRCAPPPLATWYGRASCWPAAHRRPLGGMTVKVATARHISLHLGQTHCSCSDGCKRSFEKEPAKYQEKVLTAWMR